VRLAFHLPARRTEIKQRTERQAGRFEVIHALHPIPGPRCPAACGRRPTGFRAAVNTGRIRTQILDRPLHEASTDQHATILIFAAGCCTIDPVPAQNLDSAFSPTDSRHPAPSALNTANAQPMTRPGASFAPTP
jgi:hypothetical protein